MYSENNRRTPACRANDEFLRRMLGGELGGGCSGEKAPVPSCHGGKSACNGEKANCNGKSQAFGGMMQRNSAGDSYPSGNCPTTVNAPSLSMVYSPKQCWQNVFEPMDGLLHGSIFAELVLPLEVGRCNCAGEVRSCK